MTRSASVRMMCIRKSRLARHEVLGCTSASTAALIAAMILGYRLVQILFMLPVLVLGQAMLQVVATVASYPLVVLAARWLLGLRRPGRPD